MEDIASNPDAPSNAKAADMTAADTLYETDFYAWTQQQAELLRQGRLAQADIANILEEIETLGRKEIAELRSRYRVLAQHLLKQMLQPEKAGRSWTTTVLRQRIEIAHHIEDNPSLKAKADALFLKAYAEARKLAAAETGLALDRFPTKSPFTREQAVDQSWHPDAALEK